MLLIRSLPCKRLSEGLNRITSNEVICCFCRKTDTENNLHRAGTYNTTQSKTNESHVNNLTKRWKAMVVVIVNDHVMRTIYRLYSSK